MHPNHFPQRHRSSPIKRRDSRSESFQRYSSQGLCSYPLPPALRIIAYPSRKSQFAEVHYLPLPPLNADSRIKQSPLSSRWLSVFFFLPVEFPHIKHLSDFPALAPPRFVLTDSWKATTLGVQSRQET